MADSTLDSELFILNHAWGIPVLTQFSVPTGGFTDSSHHNVADAQYGVGSAVAVKNPDNVAGKPGWSILMYMQIGTQNDATSCGIAAKSALVPDSATVWYQLTNDPDDCVAIPTDHGAYALSAMTDAYYGWVWTGGVCPEGLVSGLAGNFATNGSVAAGMISFTDLAADYAGMGPYATTTGYAGFALAADA